MNGSFHDAEGKPLIDLDTFPDMAAMVRLGRSLGLLPGWYLNNCKCQESMLTDPAFVDLTMQRTVEAMVAFNVRRPATRDAPRFPPSTSVVLSNLSFLADSLTHASIAGLFIVLRCQI